MTCRGKRASCSAEVRIRSCRLNRPPAILAALRHRYGGGLTAFRNGRRAPRSRQPGLAPGPQPQSPLRRRDRSIPVIASRSISVADRAGADKVYVFEFEPGDLGKKRFVAQRFRISSDAIETTYADTPIRELSGRPFRYVRSR